MSNDEILEYMEQEPVKLYFKDRQNKIDFLSFLDKSDNYFLSHSEYLTFYYYSETPPYVKSTSLLFGSDNKVIDNRGNAYYEDLKSNNVKYINGKIYNGVLTLI